MKHISNCFNLKSISNTRYEYKNATHSGSSQVENSNLSGEARRAKTDYLPSPQTLDSEAVYFELIRLSPSEQDVLNALFRYTNIYKRAYPSQTTLGLKTDFCRQTVNRFIRKFCKLGILKKIREHTFITCEYFLHPSLYDFKFRNSLSGIFSNLKYMPIFLLGLVCAQQFLEAKAAQFNIVTPFNKTSFIKKQRTTNLEYVSNKTFYKQEESMLEKIKNELQLGEYEISELSKYDETILRKAYDVFCKTTKHIDNKFGYIRGICKKLLDKNSTPSAGTSTSSTASVGSFSFQEKYEPVWPPIPWTSISYEDNLMRFSKWYNEHAEQFAHFKNCSKDLLIKRFMNKLNYEFDPEIPKSTETKDNYLGAIKTLEQPQKASMDYSHLDLECALGEEWEEIYEV